MKKFYLSLVFMLALALPGYSQFFFDVEIDPEFEPETIVLPPSPLKFQILFIGDVDKVQTTETYGNAPGEALAKQWHDFIGFTEDTESDDFGWVTVNHERIQANDSIGDGGGMTAFKVRRNPITDEIELVDQTLADGRTGTFFNVDFVNTVGETGMNCGGIVSKADGRIWTAEEWFRTSNASIWAGGEGVRDTADWTIDTDIPGDFNGSVIPKFENFNYMVEIDPREAVAIRKQYNWGRQGFEGGVVMADNQTVFLGADATPGIFTRFIADTPGDFTQGTLWAYKHDATGDDGPWVELPSNSLDVSLNYTAEALTRGATMFNRLEWLATLDGKIYMTETGRDGIGSRFENGAALGGVLDNHWLAPVRLRHPELASKPDEGVLDFVLDGGFNDYYGRVLEFDPATGLVTTFVEGGPFFEESPELSAYPDVHLSNPDGLNFLSVGGKDFMIINEDLNGTSNGRVPAGISNRTCELYLLDMDIVDPTPADLVRISIVPLGAEVTGAIATPDGKTIMINSQHPSSDNPFPYNNSLTYAITGWDNAVSAITGVEDELVDFDGLKMWPNPVSRMLQFNKQIDLAIYNNQGQRIRVYRSMSRVDVSDLEAGIYFIKTAGGETKKLIVQ